MTTWNEGWWLIVCVGGIRHIWPVGDPDEQTRDELITRGRVAAGMPAGDIHQPSGPTPTYVQLTLGRPHDSLLAVSTVHEPGELDAVAAGAVAAHRAECSRIRRQAAMDGARAALAGLSDEDRGQLFAEWGAG